MEEDTIDVVESCKGKEDSNYSLLTASTAKFYCWSYILPSEMSFDGIILLHQRKQRSEIKLLIHRRPIGEATNTTLGATSCLFEYLYARSDIIDVL